MIIGGEVTKQRITFSVDKGKSPASIRGIFAGHFDFFSIPPYNEKVDVNLTDDSASFSKTSLADFSYEEFVCIIKKLISFSKIEVDTAFDLIKMARQEMSHDATFFFPDFGSPYVEAACFYNWLRVDFFSPRFKPQSERLKISLGKMVGDKFKIFSNNIDDFSFYNWNDSSILVGRDYITIIAEVIIAYGFLPGIQREDFIDGLSCFTIKKYASYEANDLYKKSRSVISDENSANARSQFEFITKILSALAKRGRISDLEKEQIDFLIKSKENAKEIEKFSNLSLLRDTLKGLIEKLDFEITNHTSSGQKEIEYNTDFTSTDEETLDSSFEEIKAKKTHF